MEKKPIETRYKGYRFRSRLEARWAVFFDALGIKWEYEVEGFETEKGERYLPDFYFPDYDWYGEVKPPRKGSGKEIAKAFPFIGNKIKVLIIFGNIPEEREKEVWYYSAIYYHPIREELRANRIAIDIGYHEENQKAPKGRFNGWLAVDYNELIPVSTDNDNLPVAINDIDLTNRCDASERIIYYSEENYPRTEPKFYWSEAIGQGSLAMLHMAYAKARGARFEHGEHGGIT